MKQCYRQSNFNLNSSFHGRIFIYLTISTFAFLYIYIWYTDHTRTNFFSIEIRYNLNNDTKQKYSESDTSYYSDDGLSDGALNYDVHSVDFDYETANTEYKDTGNRITNGFTTADNNLFAGDAELNHVTTHGVIYTSDNVAEDGHTITAEFINATDVFNIADGLINKGVDGEFINNADPTKVEFPVVDEALNTENDQTNKNADVDLNNNENITAANYNDDNGDLNTLGNQIDKDADGEYLNDVNIDNANVDTVGETAQTEFAMDRANINLNSTGENNVTENDANTELVGENEIVTPGIIENENTMGTEFDIPLTPSYVNENEVTEAVATENIELDPNHALSESIKNNSLLLDTSGCKIPNLDPYDPTVIELLETVGDWVCPGNPVFMKTEPNGTISLIREVFESNYNISEDNLTCHYEPVFRHHPEDVLDREQKVKFGEPVRLVFDEPLNTEHVRVKCDMGLENGELFEHYFPLVYLKDDVEEERSKLDPPDHRLNIILTGVDSISRINSLRHLKQSRAFLEDKMEAFEMKGYSKVADNTFPNLVPLLLGDFVENLWNETNLYSEFVFDSADFLWNQYANRGYRTFYAEDMPQYGTFTYLKRGFYDQPTDYYLRPLTLAYGNWSLKPEKGFCLNTKLETDFIYDYLFDFIRVMEDRPFFAFTMASTVTHDYLNDAGFADTPTLGIMEDLWNSGILNKSVFVLFSDHGLRFGDIRKTYIGKIEERLPFMYIYFPKWFLEQHPDIGKNLATNQNRLMTFFDLNATLKHLLNLEDYFSAGYSNSTLGRSLFEEIPENRTCKDANILPHWCTCQDYQDLPKDDTHVALSSQALVNHINKQLEVYGDRCATLEVDVVIDARLGLVNDEILRFEGLQVDVLGGAIYYGEKLDNLRDYLITVQTKPGGGVFEGTVRNRMDLNLTDVLGISRINMYGNQSHCIDNQKLKLFCYCN